jgi:hypothetical protein
MKPQHSLAYLAAISLFLLLYACTAGERVLPENTPGIQTPGAAAVHDLQTGLPGSIPTSQPTEILAPQFTPPASATSPPTIVPLPELLPVELVQPPDFTYLGAFSLPEGSERPLTFEYGGNAMTFRPGATGQGLPGSLFISGHDRLPYGELPDGSQVAELSIPIPSLSRDVTSLPQAEFIQGFHDVAGGYFTEMEEIVRLGMQYLQGPPGNPKIHLAWGQHFEPDPPSATHAWFSPDLSNPNLQGAWFIGQQSFYAVNDYLFEIPADWADAFTEGRYLATGRFRDGGWSGMGPALFAYRPWLPDGSSPPTGMHLPETMLLRYESSMQNENIERCLDGYQHPDEWAGGAWLETADEKSAVLLAGTKSSGGKYWYGYTNPAGPEHPCVDRDFVGQFPVCRLADGSDCPPEDLLECDGHDDFRGWWSSRFDAQFILYDPNDLARVAIGKLEPWQPQPYAVIDIDEHLYFSPPDWDQAALGRADQRRYRIGDVAYDRENGYLYVLELYAQGARPVVHVWQVQ